MVSVSYFLNYETLLQHTTDVLLQNATKVYYKMCEVFYYKNVTVLLRNMTVITKCEVYCKMTRHIPKIKTFILYFYSLIHLSMTFSHNKSNGIKNLETCPKNEFFTMETLNITSKNN